jgi:phosphoglycolate phosphatase
VTVLDEVRTVVFDLDGTLVDSATEIVDALNAVLATRGAASVEMATVRHLIGRPPEELFGIAGLDHEVSAAVSDFRERLRRSAGDPSCVYPGVLPMLATLRRSNYQIGVATTKPSLLAETLSERYGLRPFVDHVQGTDGFPAKPSPEVVVRCLSALGARHGFMVGDTPDDVTAGRAAGLRTIAVNHGTRTRAELEECDADHLIENVSEVTGVVLLQARRT